MHSEHPTSWSQTNSTIDYVFGINYSYRFLKTDGNNSTTQTIFNDRENYEFGKIGFRAGINYNKKISKKFFLKTGIRISRIGYQDERIVDLRFGNNHSGNGNFNGEPNLNNIKVSYNYWFTEILIAGRYEFGKNKIKPYFEIGISPSIYLTTEFRSKRNEEKSKDVRRENLNSVHIAGFSSFGINYLLNSKIQLFGQPTFRYHITKLVDAPIKENLFDIGIEVGIRNYLN